MWELCGHDGVAILTRYDLLYDALDSLSDETHLGQIEYGTDHLTNRFNTLELVTTKQKKCALDCEVRALITACDPLARDNRHIDLDNYPLPVNPRNAYSTRLPQRRTTRCGETSMDEARDTTSDRIYREIQCLYTMLQSSQ
jgi:thioester reductase-like protein